MKKNYSFKNYLMFILLCIGFSFASSQTFVVEGINYQVIQGTSVKVIKKTPNYTGEITIPSTFDDSGISYQVKEIGENAFQSSQITSITLPASIETIGKNAFDSSKLTTITMPSALISLGNYAFRNCSNLTSINLNEGLTTIGEGVFNKTGLVSIQLPSTIKSIGKSAFWECKSLTSITLNEGLETIGQESFYGSGLTSVTMPSTLLSMATGAFSNCADLKTANLNIGLTSIGAAAFASSGISSISMPSTLTNIGNTAFKSCKSLTTVMLNEGLTEIGTETFAESGITSFVMPSTIIKIGNYAFKNCNSLTSFTSLAASPFTVPANAFDGEWQANCTLRVPADSFNAYTNANYWKNFKIESINDLSIFEIDGIAYQIITDTQNKEVRVIRKTPIYSGSITIPTTTRILGNTYNVVEIGAEAFRECKDLTSVTLSDGLTTIGNQAFAFSGLTAISIPSSVTTIGKYAFSFCFDLTSVTLNEGLTEIGQFTFTSSGLTSITLPSTITNIGDAAFAECLDLTSVTLNEGLTTIGHSAFYQSGLTSVIIPSSLTNIGEAAFTDCDDLTKFTSLATTPPALGIDVFSGGWQANCDLIAPNDSYKEADQWNQFKNMIAPKAFIIDGIAYETIADSPTLAVKVVANPSKYTGIITLPSTVTYDDKTYQVTEIGEDAFRGTSDLLLINLNEGLKSIGNFAFSRSGLAYITLPSTVETIGEESFSYNTKLRISVLNENLKSIGHRAFTGSAFMFFVVNQSTTPPSLGDAVFPDLISGASSNNLFVPKESEELYKLSNQWLEFAINPKLEADDVLVTPIVTEYLGTGYRNRSITVENPIQLKVIEADGMPYSGVITIPETLEINGETFVITTIGESAFENSDVTSVSLPASIKHIEDLAFKNNMLLTQFSSFATTPPSLGNDVFAGGWQSSSYLLVPPSALTDYQVADQWKDFGNKETLFTSSVKLNNLSIYPNPAKDFAIISNIKKGANISIFDASGKLVFQTIANDSKITINTSTYNNGLYLVNVDGQTSKLMIAK